MQQSNSTVKNKCLYDCEHRKTIHDGDLVIELMPDLGRMDNVPIVALSVSGEGEE